MFLHLHPISVSKLATKSIISWLQILQLGHWKGSSFWLPQKNETEYIRKSILIGLYDNHEVWGSNNDWSCRNILESIFLSWENSGWEKNETLISKKKWSLKLWNPSARSNVFLAVQLSRAKKACLKIKFKDISADGEVNVRILNLVFSLQVYGDFSSDLFTTRISI